MKTLFHNFLIGWIPMSIFWWIVDGEGSSNFLTFPQLTVACALAALMVTVFCAACGGGP